MVTILYISLINKNTAFRRKRMTEPSSKPQPKNIPRFKDIENLEIEYSNLVRIAHSPSEMIFDFARILPGDEAAVINSRIVMTPLSAKLFYKAFAENLAKYEANFGEIKIPHNSSLAGNLFHPPNPK
jgi:hypothetical protein